MALGTLRTGKLLTITFSLLYYSATGQTSTIDSLNNRLKSQTKRDTSRVNTLNKIAYANYPVNTDSVNFYSKESYTLSKELGYLKGEGESLWLQGISYIKKDPEKALPLFENALKIVEQAHDKKGIGKFTNAIGTVFGVTGRDSLAASYFLKAIDIAIQINDKNELGKYLINLSQAYNRMGRVELAVQGYSDAIEALKAVDDKINLATCYNSLGNIYTVQGNYPRALECFQRGMKIREEMNDMNAVSRSLVSIGSIYFTQKNYEKALEYNQKVAEIARNSNDEHSLAGSFINIGLIYLQTNNNEALNYFLKALEISKNLKIAPLHINILLNIGRFYFLKSENDKALANFTEALKQSEIIGNKSFISLSKLQIAKVYQIREEYSKALSYALSSLEIVKTLKIIESEKDLHKILSELYAKTNNFKSAYTHSILFKQLSDKMYNESNVRQIAEMEFAYKFEKEKQAIALEQLKKDEIEKTKRRQQQSLIVILATCFILVSLLALYINRLYRINKSVNRAIRKMELENKRLLEKEIERINGELEQNQKSLTAASLKLIQNSERDAETVGKLESLLANTTPDGKKIILALMSDFKRISIRSSWNEFELLFQKVHNSFYEKLNESFPNLTANERRLCAFLKLNMSNKDIANITFQSEEALKKARMRLRQKLGIDRDTNLVIYLQNI
ncbi:MAG: tetratricopeptide repeat protein [Bacteroidales bacterium]